MKKADLITILRSPQTVFTFKDIVLLTREQNPLFLKQRLHYYVRQGDLYHIRRGIYAKDKEYDRFELATKIYTPSYVSMETVLSREGVIFQYDSRIASASYLTREISCDGATYMFRRIKRSILVNSHGIVDKGTHHVATKERAFMDMVYIFKNYHFDNVSGINWDECFALAPIYENKAMRKHLDSYYRDAQQDNP